MSFALAPHPIQRTFALPSQFMFKDKRHSSGPTAMSSAEAAERGCLLDDVDGCCLARQALRENWGKFAKGAKTKRRLEKMASELEEHCW